MPGSLGSPAALRCHAQQGLPSGARLHISATNPALTFIRFQWHGVGNVLFVVFSLTYHVLRRSQRECALMPTVRRCGSHTPLLRSALFQPDPTVDKTTHTDTPLGKRLIPRGLTTAMTYKYVTTAVRRFVHTKLHPFVHGISTACDQQSPVKGTHLGQVRHEALNKYRDTQPP